MFSLFNKLLGNKNTQYCNVNVIEDVLPFKTVEEICQKYLISFNWNNRNLNNDTIVAIFNGEIKIF